MPWLLQALVANGGVNSVPTQGLKWRTEWDSNPRYLLQYTRFPSVRLKPLGHLSSDGRGYSGISRWARGERGVSESACRQSHHAATDLCTGIKIDTH